METAELWRWIWLTAAVAFVVGEMTTAGAFFLLPFGIGASAAAVLAFLDVALGWEWLAFLAISVASLAALRPLARRLEVQTPMQSGVGASRWVGRVGVVLKEIPAGPSASGTVMVDREEWRAESGGGEAIGDGSTVRVVAVEGTRLVVEPMDKEG